MDKKKNMSLEEHFIKIEEIIKAMEDGEATLDESFDLYKKGLDEIKSANAILDNMEQAMIILQEDENMQGFGLENIS